MDASQGQKTARQVHVLLMRDALVPVRHHLLQVLTASLSKDCSSASAMEMETGSVLERSCQSVALQLQTPMKNAAVAVTAQTCVSFLTSYPLSERRFREPLAFAIHQAAHKCTVCLKRRYRCWLRS